MPRSKPPSSTALHPIQWLSFGPTVTSELELALEKEWFIANGIGGYASSSILGCNTRARHGLLIAATKPPQGLILMLSKFEETLYILDQPYPLSTNCFPDSVFPKGYQYLKRFTLNPFPTFTFEIEDFRLEKTVLLRHGQNTVVVHYRLISGEEELVRLEMKPLVSFRAIHEAPQNTRGREGELSTSKGQVRYKPPGMIPPLYFAHQAAIVDKAGEWYGKVVYPCDQDLAEPASEELYAPCTFVYSFMLKDQVMLAASTQPLELPASFEELAQRERERVLKFLQPSSEAATPVEQLTLQSAHFCVQREDSPSIIRGFHGGIDGAWASFIALPGFFLVSGRYEEAKTMLIMYASLMDKGFLPSSFREEDGEPEYRSIDAAFWFAESVFLYGQYSEDFHTIEKKLYPALKRMIKHYQLGTHFGVKAADDGLIEQRDPSVALTWMDATVRGAPVTPRWGKAVEVNALWFNALKITETLAIKFRDAQTSKALDRLSLKVYESFNKVFWNEGKQLLYDCIQGDRKDASIRPNQIFSISLTFAVLDKKCWPAVLQTVTQELLTPFGLRTLAKRSKSYHARCAGDRYKRALAEHQGTVWAWLMGPYARAYLRAYGGTKTIKQKLLQLFNPLFNQMNHYGLNAISSMYDGNAPHAARGMVADACAAAEVIRSYDDLTSEGPRKEMLREFELR